MDADDFDAGDVAPYQPMTPDEATFKATVAEFEAAGVHWRQAYRQAARKHPDIFRRLTADMERRNGR